jgi:hypothetical protein
MRLHHRHCNRSSTHNEFFFIFKRTAITHWCSLFSVSACRVDIVHCSLDPDKTICTGIHDETRVHTTAVCERAPHRSAIRDTPRNRRCTRLPAATTPRAPCDTCDNVFVAIYPFANKTNTLHAHTQVFFLKK